MRHLKALALVCVVSSCLLSPMACSSAAHPDANLRSFALPPDQPKVSGYAEVLFHVKKSGPSKHEFLARTRIWFDGKERYRIEYLDVFKRNPSTTGIMLRRGTHVYTTMTDPDPRDRGHWWGGPESCMQGLLETSLTPGVSLKMRDARLLGVERVSDLRAEHWRGKTVRGTPCDVYKSVDPRFPLVLARESRLPGYLFIWRMTKLEIRPVPAYVFSTQAHPKAGVWPMLAQPFRPYPVTLALHIVLLCCYIAFAFFLARGGSRRSLFLTLLSGCAVLLVLYVSRVPTDYWYQWSDVPPMLLLGLLTCAAMALIWRLAGSPGKIAFKGKIGWQALIWAVALGSFAFASQYARQHQLAHSLTLDRWTLPFLPLTLLNVMVYIIPDVGMQELVFRGYIYAALERRLQSPAKVIVIQALLFAVYHWPRDLNNAVTHSGGLLYLLDGPAMVLFGVLFGVLRWKTRGLAAPWLVHAAFNVAYFYVASASMLGILRAISN